MIVVNKKYHVHKSILVNLCTNSIMSFISNLSGAKCRDGSSPIPPLANVAPNRFSSFKRYTGMREMTHLSWYLVACTNQFNRKD
jgi:hypothetical protein